MAQFYTRDILEDYCAKREERGITCWCPNQYQLKDCRVSIMEGDDHHRQIFDEVPVDKSHRDLTAAEFNAKFDNINRSMWNMKVNENGKKTLGTMYWESNQLYFSNKTLQNTPINHTQL